MPRDFNIVARINLYGPSNIRSIVRNIQSQLNSINATVNINLSTTVIPRLNVLNNNLQRIDAGLRSIRNSANLATTSLQQFASVLSNIQTGLNNINTKPIVQAASAANKGASAMSSFGGQAGLAVRRFLAFAGPTTVFFGLISAIREGVLASIEFEKEMIRLSQVTGRSISSLSDLSEEITRLSTSLGVSSKELGNVATTLAQAGLNSADTKTALEALARSGLAATFTDMAQTTEGAIAVFRQFGVDAEQLTGVIGSLNAVSAQFAVESDDLISAIRRTGGAFKVSGGSLNELLGLFTSVRSTTRESADSIATGFRTIFTRIQRPKTIQFLKELGVELQDAKGQFVGPLESIRRLNAALSDIPTTDPRFASVIEELGGFRQVSKVIPLIQQFPEAIKAISVAEQGQLSIIEDSVIAQKSLSNQIVKVREEFLALFRELTSDKSFQFFVKTSLELAKSLIDVARAIKPLIPLLGGLALIQVGKNVGQLTSNFSSALTGRKFAEGGIVPGSGNSDTVPALLTPGEFVINKKAAQSIGFNKLARMNRFAKGGKVDKPPLRFGIAALHPTGAKKLQQFPMKFDAVVNGKKEKINENIELHASGIGNNFAKKSEETIYKKIGGAASEIAFALQKKIGAEPIQQTAGLQSILDKSGFKNIVGHIFEASLALAGAPYSDKQNDRSPIDFPRGLGQVAKAFEGLPSDVPTESKRTIDVTEFKRRNLKNELIRLAASKSLIPEINIENKNKADDNKVSNTNFSNIKSGTVFTVKQLAELVGNKNAGQKELSQLPFVKEAFTNRKGLSGFTFIKKASGGIIPGEGDTDSVPSLLTPGEFVINKKAADRIGRNNLEKLNKGQKLEKFARGGAVRPGTGTGLGAGGLLLLGSSVTSLIPSFTELDNETNNLIKTFTSIALAATGVSFGLKSVANTQKVDKAKRTLELFAQNPRSVNKLPLVDKAVLSMAANLDKLSIGIGAAAGTLTVFGEQLKTSALSAAKLADSESELNSAIQKDRSGSILSGIGTGGGIGAAIGTAIAPGIGTAIGAVIGGFAGGAFGAKNSDTENLIKAFRQSKFDKISDKLDTLFDNLNSNRIDNRVGGTDIGEALKTQLSNIGETPNLEQRGELIKQFRNNLVNIRTFSQTITKTVNDISEFENVFGGAGTSIINSIALLTNKSIPAIRQEIENEINIRKKVTEAEKKRSSSSENIEKSIIGLDRFNEALNVVSDSIELANNKFLSISSLQTGQQGGGQFNAIPNNFFERVAAGQITEIKKISSAITNLVGDSVDNTIIQETQDVAILANTLPDILKRLSKNVGLNADNESAQRFFEREIDIIDNLSDSMKNIVKDIFSAEVASRAGGGESGIISVIREDLQGFANKLQPETSKSFVSQFSDIQKTVKDQLDNIDKRLTTQREFEFNLTKQKVSLEEKLLQISKSRLKEDESLTFDEIISTTRKQQKETLRNTAFAGAANRGEDINLSRIEFRFKQLEELQNDARNRLNSNDPQERVLAQLDLSNLNDEANRLRTYLKDLSESTLELTNRQEALSKAESDRKSGFSLIEKLLLGDGRDRVAFAKFTQNALDISGGRKNLTNLNPQARKEFIDFLGQLPQNKPLSLLGGKNVDEFKKDQIRKGFVERAGVEGFNVDIARDFINEQSTTSKEEKVIQKQINNIQDRSTEATKTLINIDSNLILSLDKLNSTLLNEFPNKFREALSEIKIGKLEIDRKSLVSERDTKTQNLIELNKVSREELGVTGPESIDLIKRIKANEPFLRKRGEAKEEIERLNNIKFNSSDLLTSQIAQNIGTGGFLGSGIPSNSNPDQIKSLLAVLGREQFDNNFGNRLEAEEFEKRLANELANTKISGGLEPNKFTGGKFSLQAVDKTERSFFAGDEKSRQAVVDFVIQRELSRFRASKTLEQLQTVEKQDKTLSKSGIEPELIQKFSNTDNLKTFIDRVSSLDEVLFKGINPLDEYANKINSINQAVASIDVEIAKTKVQTEPATPKATGGIINGKSISRPMVSFTPRGTDTVPAILTAGEYVVNKKAASANLPLLQHINTTNEAVGFVGGGRVEKFLLRKQLLENRAKAKEDERQKLARESSDSPFILTKPALKDRVEANKAARSAVLASRKAALGRRIPEDRVSPLRKERLDAVHKKNFIQKALGGFPKVGADPKAGARAEEFFKNERNAAVDRVKSNISVTTAARADRFTEIKKINDVKLAENKDRLQKAIESSNLKLADQKESTRQRLALATGKPVFPTLASDEPLIAPSAPEPIPFLKDKLDIPLPEIGPLDIGAPRGLEPKPNANVSKQLDIPLPETGTLDVGTPRSSTQTEVPDIQTAFERFTRNRTKVDSFNNPTAGKQAILDFLKKTPGLAKQSDLDALDIPVSSGRFRGVGFRDTEIYRKEVDDLLKNAQQRINNKGPIEPTNFPLNVQEPSFGKFDNIAFPKENINQNKPNINLPQAQDKVEENIPLFMRLNDQLTSGIKSAGSTIGGVADTILGPLFGKRKKFNRGGSVFGVGNNDNVPALLTPGEFVLNKRAAKALGLGTLENFNKRFATGGPVQAGNPPAGSSAEIKNISLDGAAMAALDNFSKSASALNGSLSRFADVSSSLSSALGSWVGVAAKMSEALSSFPAEVQINHSQLNVVVSIAGLEGLEQAVQDKVMQAVNERLGQQRANAVDGKSPFFSK